MRLNKPRIAPLQESDWNEEQRKYLAPYAERGQLYNIYKTLGHNPDAFQAFIGWGSYVLRRSSLPPRERELIILRVGFLCKAGYEWAQHVRIGTQAGLSDVEIARIKIGSQDPDWNDQDRILLVAAEELHDNYFISDATWHGLRNFLTETQCMDLVFVVGQYTQVCMMLNTFGVQLDEGLVSDAELVQD